jgi:hypothetical protein
MPDILHEILKGVFVHLRDWIKAMIGDLGGSALELYDNRFMQIPHFGGMKTWTAGLSTLKQLNGRDEKEIMRVSTVECRFLPLALWRLT